MYFITLERVVSCGAEPVNWCSVREYYCASSENVGLTIETCPDGCSDGACIELQNETPIVVINETPPTPPIPLPVITPTKCTDSDKGKKIFVKGSATLIYPNGTKQTLTDSCNKDGTVKEWYCKGNGALSVNIKCPVIGFLFHCSNGACKFGK